MSSKTLKQIAISEENYLFLKKLGNAGDSFNDVITELLANINLSHSDPHFGPINQTLTKAKGLDMEGE